MPRDISAICSDDCPICLLDVLILRRIGVILSTILSIACSNLPASSCERDITDTFKSPCATQSAIPIAS